MFIRYNTEDGQVGDPFPSLIWTKLAVIGDADNRSEKPYEASCTSKRPPLTAADIRSRMVDDRAANQQSQGMEPNFPFRYRER